MIQRPIRRVLVACRGEQAASLVHVLEGAGIETVTVFDDTDAEAPHLDVSAWPVPLPASAASAPEGLDPAALIGLALDAGADAVHPGTGPLRADAEAARMVMNVGLAWIGARPDALAAYASADAVRARAAAAGIAFSDAGAGRRIVVALVGDGEGDALVLGDHHAVSDAVRETPAPVLDDVGRARLWDAAARLARADKMLGAAAITFLVDARGGVRLEKAALGIADGWTLHDEAWGASLALAELRLHAGESIGVARADVRVPPPTVEVALRAVSDGVVSSLRFDGGVHVTAGVNEGACVRAGTVLARLRVGGPTHAAARVRARAAVEATRVGGVQTDADALLDALSDPARWPA